MRQGCLHDSTSLGQAPPQQVPATTESYTPEIPVLTGTNNQKFCRSALKILYLSGFFHSAEGRNLMTPGQTFALGKPTSSQQKSTSCVAHCPGVPVRSEHHSQLCRLPIHDHQFFTDVGLSLPLIRRAIPNRHYFKMDSSEHPPYVRIGVDAEHDLIGINRESGFFVRQTVVF